MYMQCKQSTYTHMCENWFFGILNPTRSQLFFRLTKDLSAFSFAEKNMQNHGFYPRARHSNHSKKCLSEKFLFDFYEMVPFSISNVYCYWFPATSKVESYCKLSDSWQYQQHHVNVKSTKKIFLRKINTRLFLMSKCDVKSSTSTSHFQFSLKGMSGWHADMVSFGYTNHSL